MGGVLDLIAGTVGKLPDSFVYNGRRYPLASVYKHIEGSAEAQQAVLAAVLESEAVGESPEPVGVPLPEKLILRATDVRPPTRTGGGAYPLLRVASILGGESNANYGAKVWFSVDPVPDPGKAIPELLGRTRVAVQYNGDYFDWQGNGTKHDRGDGVLIADGGLEQDFGFDGGTFKSAYARSDGFHFPVKLTREGEYYIWVDLDIPGGALRSNRIGPIRAS